MVRDMLASSKMTPGQPGTWRLTRQCGDRLICVRYRYDALRRRRYTTAEKIREPSWSDLCNS